MTTPEGRVKAKFNKEIKAIQARHPGKLFARMPVIRGMGKPLLDYLFCANGKFIAVEAKRDDTHDLTPQQKATAREMAAAGAETYKVYDEFSAMCIAAQIERYL